MNEGRLPALSCSAPAFAAETRNILVEMPQQAATTLSDYAAPPVIGSGRQQAETNSGG
jgi:hypothetical protein